MLRLTFGTWGPWLPRRLAQGTIPAQASWNQVWPAPVGFMTSAMSASTVNSTVGRRVGVVGTSQVYRSHSRSFHRALTPGPTRRPLTPLRQCQVVAVPARSIAGQVGSGSTEVASMVA